MIGIDHLNYMLKINTIKRSGSGLSLFMVNITVAKSESFIIVFIIEATKLNKDI